MIKAILIEIEGAFSSQSFVQDSLLPYVRERMGPFIREHADDEKVAGILADVRRHVGAELSDEQVAEQLVRWSDEGRTFAALSSLQELIWKQAYERDGMHAHVYEDAVQGVRSWKERGMRLYTFSSAPVQTQQLLFGHTEHGDLTPLVDEYFDTTVGAKDDPTAYQSIATSVGLSPSEILFASHAKEELDAARQIGMYTVWVVRQGATDPAAAHLQVTSVAEIEP